MAGKVFSRLRCWLLDELRQLAGWFVITVSIVLGFTLLAGPVAVWEWLGPLAGTVVLALVLSYWALAVAMNWRTMISEIRASRDPKRFPSRAMDVCEEATCLLVCICIAPFVLAWRIVTWPFTRHH